jgi:hypothetical protein
VHHHSLECGVGEQPEALLALAGSAQRTFQVDVLGSARCTA